jgi:choline dehydrogenase-like flavoprotein
MFNALKRIPGIESPKEAADGSKHGVIWAPNSIDAQSQRRSYSKIGHYDEVKVSRDNLHLLPAHRVTKVLLTASDDEDGAWAASGVSYTPRDGGRGEIFDVKARKEVVVSAGTFHTPQVLQRSGIGPRDVLEDAGVEVKVELPGVGWNFQSHTAFGVSHRFNKVVFPSDSDLLLNRTFQRDAQRQWDTDKTGPYTAYVNSGGFLPFPVFSNATDEIIAKLEQQSPEDYLPEGLDPTLVRGFAVQKEILTRQLASKKSAWLEYLFFGQSTTSAILLHIFSRGTVKISPDDDGLDTPPEVDYRSFTNPVDLDLNVELLKGVRWFMGHPEMVEAVRPVETSPGVNGDATIRTWLRRNLNPSVAHQVGTAALGPKELGGVVGPGLTVYGVQKLSVADNSVVPLVPGSHTSALAYAIGEKVRSSQHSFR